MRTFTFKSNNKYTTRVVLDDDFSACFCLSTVAGLIANLTQLLERVPEQLRDTIDFSIHGPDTEYICGYDYPSTEEEIAKYAQEMKARQDARKEGEIKLLQELQEKYKNEPCLQKTPN